MGLSATYMDLEGYGDLDRTERRDPGVAAGRSRAPMAVKAAARVLRTMVPGARIVRLYPVWRVSRFGQEWSLRRVRARRDQDLPRMVLAQTLLDALERVPRGWLVEGQLEHEGALYAVWVDADRSVWLGLAERPAEVSIEP